MPRKLPFDWFPLGLAAAVALAWLIPQAGAHDSALHPALVNKAGVALIFFLSGVSLPFAALTAGTLRWPLHVVIQSCTYVLFPLMGLAVYALGGLRMGDGDAWLPPDMRLGFLFLCALPSTVSSAVALTAAAGGNVAVAVFNASLSSILGVFLTPLWLSLVLAAGGASVPVGSVILDLARWLILPLVIGQACRPLFGAWAARHKRRLAMVDRLIILFMIYTSFCDAFLGGVWGRYGFGAVLIILCGSVLLFAAALWTTTAVSRALRFPRDERIAAVFIGSTKSLATGVPMAQLIFPHHPGLSMILLPIMLYHPLQLVACGVLAGRWARGWKREAES